MVTGEGEVGAASVDKRCGIPFDDATGRSVHTRARGGDHGALSTAGLAGVLVQS
jgi:hypothetical protein